MSDTKHTPMVVAAARTMCKLESEGCGVDNDDLWKIYGAEFLKDAEKVVEATVAYELLHQLELAEGRLMTLDAMKHPAIPLNDDLIESIRAAIAAATAPEQAK